MSGKHRNTSQRRRCGHRWITLSGASDSVLHKEHVCGLMIGEGKVKHPGKHQCNEWHCPATEGQ
jgi:hypothetical protein